MPPERKFAKKAAPHRSAGPWGQERRLEFIDFRLRWDGRLNRADLMSHFGISVPQASADIARYTELAPANLTYDRSERVYVPGEDFEPLFPTSSAEHYLSDLLAVGSGVLSPESSYLGWIPPMALAGAPGRVASSENLSRSLKATRQRLVMRVLYQSMSRAEPGWRELSPHAVGHDGFRWHVRAFCHERGDFRDFVIARMLEVEVGESSTVDSTNDAAWTTMVRLILMPNPQLAEPKRRVIELDYGMMNGEAELECRQAVLYYILQRLGLNADVGVKPEAQQISLKNMDEVKRYLARPAST